MINVDYIIIVFHLFLSFACVFETYAYDGVFVVGLAIVITKAGFSSVVDKFWFDVFNISISQALLEYFVTQ